MTTLLAGPVVARFGRAGGLRRAWRRRRPAAVAVVASAAVLTGMVLVAVGTFFAQAVATGFVGQAAHHNRGIASGVYLACYFLGGLIGTAVLGQLFDSLGWPSCVIGIGITSCRRRFVPLSGPAAGPARFCTTFARHRDMVPPSEPT